MFPHYSVHIFLKIKETLEFLESNKKTLQIKPCNARGEKSTFPRSPRKLYKNCFPSVLLRPVEKIFTSILKLFYSLPAHISTLILLNFPYKCLINHYSTPYPRGVKRNYLQYPVSATRYLTSSCLPTHLVISSY